MSKQEEIRAGAIVSLMDYKGFRRAPVEYIIDHIFNYLHDNDVVIRADRELPKEIDRFKGQVKRVLHQAGYVAVKPLLEYHQDPPKTGDTLYGVPLEVQDVWGK